ncbi:hypothetical protein DTL70_30265 [Streptomyces diacarni]|uniref:Integral membrane protein n=1 Tax=Streptomyces diacarni TaxID=2800381 RepID=A0A367EC46_9ACTN|nr:hypothetical protein [Streptomyces diacarni]RCG15636.1 hypothetical protein DTL70_30265 [Streptomyces diacarni]
MGKRVEPTGVVGCLVAVVTAAVGFWVWRHGAEPGLRGSFEGERDWSLLYVELPLMLFGTPAVTLAVWRLTGHLLRHRAGRVTRGVLPLAAASVTVTALAWASLLWLDTRVEPFVHPEW